VSDNPVIGISISPVPLKDTPAIVIVDANADAVAELPVQEPEEPLVFPVTFPVIFPVKVPAIAPVPVIVGDVKVLFVKVSVVFLPTNVSVEC